jgi:hypothetical protein
MSLPNNLSLLKELKFKCNSNNRLTNSNSNKSNKTNNSNKCKRLNNKLLKLKNLKIVLHPHQNLKLLLSMSPKISNQFLYRVKRVEKQLKNVSLKVKTLWLKLLKMLKTPMIKSTKSKLYQNLLLNLLLIQILYKREHFSPKKTHLILFNKTKVKIWSQNKQLLILQRMFPNSQMKLRILVQQ